MNVSITGIQRFCPHDGPGIRTVVFFKGCPLSCEWCHNPEAQSARPQVLYYAAKCVMCGCCAAVCPNGAHSFAGGTHVFDHSACSACGKCVDACPAAALSSVLVVADTGQIVKTVLSDRAFYGEEGGVTLSGGEPMAQPEAAFAVLSACKEAGVGTAVETCGYFDPRLVPRLVGRADLLLYDVKLTDPVAHEKYTGRSNKLILSNLAAVDRAGIRTRLRCIILGGINDTAEHVDAVARLYGTLSHCEGAELLPYHEYGASKAAALGRTSDPHPERVPDRERIARLSARLAEYGVPVFSRT